MNILTGTTRNRMRSGFTLLELIAVLIIMSMLAVAVTLSYTTGFYSLEKETDLLKLRIRYTQARAMGSNSPYGISCTGSKYFQFSGLGTSTKHPFPGEEKDEYSLPTDITASTFVISFDAWGVPYSNAAQTNAQGANRPLTLTTTSGGSTETKTLTITPVTGFVP